ncbi:MAG: SDR family NAD(P)-dependent oxidoreductase [Candidatus Binataceae bacterium]
MLRLAGKNALITGATSDFGRAIAIRFAQEGANVLVAAGDLDLAKEVAADAEKEGRRAIAEVVEVGDEAQVERMVQRAARELGGIDVLMAAEALSYASYGQGADPRHRIVDKPLADWHRVMNVNLDGTFLTGRAVAREMIKAGKGGRIINYASAAGVAPIPGSVDYCVAKAGIIMLTRVMALELAPHNIRVNAIAPGFLQTAMSAAFFKKGGRAEQAVLDRIPLRRFGELSEVADTAVFLASDDSSYITGQTLHPNGGLVIL